MAFLYQNRPSESFYSPWAFMRSPLYACRVRMMRLFHFPTHVSLVGKSHRSSDGVTAFGSRYYDHGTVRFVSRLAGCVFVFLTAVAWSPFCTSIFPFFRKLWLCFVLFRVSIFGSSHGLFILSLHAEHYQLSHSSDAAAQEKRTECCLVLYVAAVLFWNSHLTFSTLHVVLRVDHLDFDMPAWGRNRWTCCGQQAPRSCPEGFVPPPAFRFCI